MSQYVRPDFFWVGPQKAASTWAYHCFLEHPEVFVPGYDENLDGIGGDALQYYTIHHHRGESWYRQFFEGSGDYDVVGETTPSYLRSERAAARIASDVPDAKILMCLRSPVDRAYSHYWHERKKRTIEFDFGEALENYDLFQNWVVPGFYHHHIQRYLKYFDRDQLKILIFDDLVEDDREFLRSIWEFLEVDPNFEPDLLGQHSNEAGYPQTPLYRAYQGLVRSLEVTSVKQWLEPLKELTLFEAVKKRVFGKHQYDRGMDPEIRSELLQIYEPENRELARFLDRDLDAWNS